MLTQQDSDRIEATVRALEAQTSCEIAVCLREASGEDRGIAALTGLVTLAVAGGAATLLWPELNGHLLVGVALAAGIATYLLADWLNLGLKLLPGHLVAEDARRAARALFLDRGLDATPQRNAVLLFISRAERYVEVLPDRGLAAVVPAQRWANIVTAFQEVARQKGVVDAVTDAVARIGAVCAGPFPAGAVNPDLIPNKPLAE